MSRELFLLIVGVVVLLIGGVIWALSDGEQGGCITFIGMMVVVYATVCLVWGFAATLPSAFGGK